MNKQHIKWNFDYSKTLTMKIFLAKVSFEGKYKRRDKGDSEVLLNFEQTLEVIKKIDNLTVNMPKIVYLVGWQFSGHDSKYPAWSEVNKKLKRKQDKTALESLRWLINESKKYHTTVSLHINMFDAYEDSPLWEEYVKKDIVRKDKNGNPTPIEWGYPISYAQEWKMGLAQRRIDQLIEMIPELVESGTIHIDAFHTWPPFTKKGPISPYLDFTLEDETETQRKIFEYWAKKGIDVTSEGTNFLRTTAFEGYQPMAWWFNEPIRNYMKWTANYYCGGVDRNPIRAKLFGNSMHGESIIIQDPVNVNGFLEKFCLNVVVWQFLNQYKRLKYQNLLVFMRVKYSQNVESRIQGASHRIIKNAVKIKQNDDLCIPIYWLENSLIAYSKNGYSEKVWKLLSDWKGVKKIFLNEITLDGLGKIEVINVSDNSFKLSLKPGQAVLIQLSY